LYLRWWGLLWGLVTIFWLPTEDVGSVFLTIISLVWCAWLGSWAAWRRAQAGQRWPPVWLGAGTGLIFFPVSLFFVLFKTGLHAHGFLEFSVYQITRLAWRALALGAIGGILGAFIGRCFPEN
jgi:hypothetical protein